MFSLLNNVFLEHLTNVVVVTRLWDVGMINCWCWWMANNIGVDDNFACNNC